MLWDHRPGAEPVRRNRAAGVLAARALSGRRTPPDLRGHADRLHRGAAPLQAGRLVLPADGRGRHRLGPCRDDGAVARRCGPVRTPSRHLHPHRATSSRCRRCSARAMRIWSTRQRARPTWCICAAGRCRIAAAARSGARPRFSRWSGARTAGCGPSTATAFRRIEVPAPARPTVQPLAARAARAKTSMPTPCRSIFSGCARRDADRAVQPACAKGTSAAVRPREHRQSLHPVTRRAPAAGALLQRVDGDGIRTGSFPADGGPRLLLQQREVSLPLRVA